MQIRPFCAKEAHAGEVNWADLDGTQTALEESMEDTMNKRYTITRRLDDQGFRVAWTTADGRYGTCRPHAGDSILEAIDSLRAGAEAHGWTGEIVYRGEDGTRTRLGQL